MSRLCLVLLSVCAMTSPVLSQTYGWTDLSDRIPGDESYPDVSAIGDEVWITSGSSTELYYNDAAGTTDFLVYTTPDEFLCIHMISSSIGYAGAQNGRVFRTADGGETWALLLPLTGASVVALTFPPADNEVGYCCGDVGRVYKVEPTGTTQIPTGLYSNMSSICFPSTSHGWVCGQDVIRHYADSSGAWMSDQYYPGNFTCRKAFFVDDHNGWIVGGIGSAGAIIHTTDGVHWSYQTDPNPGNAVLNAVYFLDDGVTGWAGGNFGKVLHTEDAGATWAEVDIGTTTLVNAISFSSPTTGYLVAGSGQAYKYGLILGIEDIETDELPSDFVLSQNYPNPFNPVTSIEISLPRKSRVSVTVYDALGRKVATLVDHTLAAGAYKTDWDASNHPSGVYFYKLETNDLTVSKKMVLVK